MEKSSKLFIERSAWANAILESTMISTTKWVPKKGYWEIGLENVTAHNAQFQEETRNNQRSTTTSIKKSRGSDGTDRSTIFIMSSR